MGNTLIDINSSFFATSDNETVSIEMNYGAFTKDIPCKICSNRQEEKTNSKLSTIWKHD